MTKDKSKREQIYWHLIIKWLLFLIIIAVVMLKTSYAKFPGTTTDEFGYMSFPAGLTGWDWSELMRFFPYYGKGAGILWYPLFLVFSGEPLTIYRSIVMLNGLLIAISYLICNKCAELLFSDWNKWLCIFASLVICCFPSYFFYSQIASSEIILYFLFWLIFFLILRYTQTLKLGYLILMALIEVFMLFVHLRTAPVLAITGAYAFFLLFRKRVKWNHIALFFGIILIGVVAWIMVKNQYYSTLGEINSVNQINSNFQVVEMIGYMLRNIIMCFERLGTRFYYYFSVGGVCFTFGLVYVIKKIVQEIMMIVNKKDSGINSIFVFIGITIVANICIFVVQGFGTAYRLDMVVYGRYTDNLVGPLLLIGLYYLTTKIEWIKNIYFHIAIIIGLTPFVLYQMQESVTDIFAIDSAVGLGSFMFMDMSNQSLDFYLLKITCVILFISVSYAVCYVIMSKVKMEKLFPAFVLIITGVTWLYMEIQAEVKYNVERNELYQQYNQIAELVTNIDHEKIVYIRNSEEDICTPARYLQFLLSEEQIYVADFEDVDFNNSKDTIYLSRYNTDYLEYMNNTFENIEYTTQFIVYSNE